MLGAYFRDEPGFGSAWHRRLAHDRHGARTLGCIHDFFPEDLSRTIIGRFNLTCDMAALWSALPQDEAPERDPKVAIFVTIRKYAPSSVDRLP